MEEMNAASATVKTDDRRTYTVDEIAKALCIGKTTAYSLVKEGHFRTLKIGSAIRVSKASFDSWLDSREF